MNPLPNISNLFQKLLISSWIILLLFAIGLEGLAQQKIIPYPKNSDIEGAILVVADTLICVNTPNGFGAKNEISGSKSDNQSIEKEHNSIWYKIVVAENCQLSFKLVPFSKYDDYDFMLFEADGKTTNNLKVIRVNKARNNLKINGETGLKTESQQKYVGEGIGNSFSNSVQIFNNKTYYLLVDNVYEGGKGHQIYFYGLPKRNNKPNSASPIVKSNFRLSLNILDKETKLAVESNISIVKRNYPNPPDTILKHIGNQLITPIDSGCFYYLDIVAEGYLKHKSDFKIYPRDTFRQIEIQMQRAEIGKLIQLENIYFGGGSSVILKKSYVSLKALVETLQSNPTLEIEIIGHVHLPYPRNKKYKESYYDDLSEARAKAVYNYLIQRNIAAERLKYKGMSYHQMKFPKAISEVEQQENRRVEILILNM